MRNREEESEDEIGTIEGGGLSVHLLRTQSVRLGGNVCVCLCLFVCVCVCVCVCVTVPYMHMQQLQERI